MDGAADWTQSHGIIWCSTPGDNGNLGVPGKPSIYIARNRDDKYHPDPKQDNWPMIEAVTTQFENQGRVPEEYRRHERQEFSKFPVTVHSVDEAGRLIASSAGASRRLGADGRWTPARDAVDERLLRQFREGTGRIIRHPGEVGGWPGIVAGEAYPDADADGMSDAWEKRHGFDPKDPADAAGDADGDGFTNLDEFLAGEG